MNRTTLHLEIVTPCFLAGANQQAAPEWRGASGQQVPGGIG